MADPEPFTISSRRLSYKDLELTHHDASRTLIVPVEMSGVREFDFVGVDTSFAQWKIVRGRDARTVQRRVFRIEQRHIHC